MGRNAKIISKSKIRRVNILILILLGTQDNSFHRLLDKVQELIDKKVITEKVVVQAGRTKYESKDMEIYSLMPEEKLREIMEKADLVITHGGVGSIVMALKMGKKVIAVPRLSTFGEHINDHQIQIVDSFNKQEFLIGLTELDGMEEALAKAKEFKPKKFKSETDHMIKLIEDFMIVANETVASHIYYMQLPFIYRVHGEPDEEKINNFMRYLNILGYHITADLKKLTPKTMQNILGQLKDKKEFHLLSALLLRSMQKAIYDTNNIGHFGIASKCYTHFTSPIRRYPDTTVHRLLHTYLFDNNINNETINYYERELPFVAEHTSDTERRSIECERAVDDMKKAEYMMDHIGEEFDGIISSVMNFGMFVELPNLIEGLVKLDSLQGDYYTYDETTFTIRGNKDKRGYRLGDSVRVKVVAADKEKRTIDFEVIKHGNSEPES